MLERIVILPVPYLPKCAPGTVISFQFNDQCRISSIKRDKNDIGKAFSGSHFPDHSIAVQGIDVSKINSALQCVLVIIAPVACYMYVRDCYAAFYRSYRLQEYGKLKSHFPIYWLFVRAVFYSTFFIPYQRVSDIKIMSHIDVCHGFRYFCIKKQRKNSTFHSRLFLCPARHSTKETATKAMIRKKLLNFKLKLPFFVSDNELERFRASAVPFRERCPFCGARGNCRFYASYERSIVDIVDGKPCWRILKVVRILCACGHTHALLPDFVVPYKQYTLLFILHILHLYFSHSMTVQKLCDTFWISPPTLYEWKRAFALHRSWWPEFVRSGRKDSLDAIIFFLSRPVFSDFTSGFWQQTLFSFLQTHANPANCCRLPPGW